MLTISKGTPNQDANIAAGRLKPCGFKGLDIGSINGQSASKICEGRVVDFISSGYSDSLQIVSLGQLASISGITGIQIDIEELKPISQNKNPGSELREAVKIVRRVKSKTIQLLEMF